MKNWQDKILEKASKHEVFCKCFFCTLNNLTMENCIFLYWKGNWKCMVKDEYFDVASSISTSPHYCGRGKTPRKAFSNLQDNILNHVLVNCPLKKEEENKIEEIVHNKVSEWYRNAGSQSVMIEDMPHQAFEVLHEQFRKEAIKELRNKK